MADAAEGTIIKDLGKSLPSLQDFFYNDLDGYDTEQLPDDAATIWYQEDPPESGDYLGMSANGALLSIKLPKDAFSFSVQGALANAYSGNAMHIDLSKAEYGGFDSVKNMLDQFKEKSDLAAYYAQIGAADKELYEKYKMGQSASLRLLYCNLPEIPRFMATEVEQDAIEYHKYSEIKDNIAYQFCKAPYPYQLQYTQPDQYGAIAWSCPNYRQATNNIKKKYNDDDQIAFVKQDNVWHQVIELERFNKDRHDGTSPLKRNVLLLDKDETSPAEAARAYAAKDVLLEYIEKAKDIRLVIDTNTLTGQASTTAYLSHYPLEYTNTTPTGNFTNYIKDLANRVLDDSWYRYAGYVPYGLDKYRRIAGVLYIQVDQKMPNSDKVEPVWYNLNKLIIAKANNQAAPVESASATGQYHLNYGPVALKGYTYDYENRVYVDRFWRKAGENEENRRKVQRQIFQQEQIGLFPNGSGTYATDEDVLYNWTVAIGDVTFFVPPENIRVVSQTETTRVPVMRAKGSIAKGRERSMQYLELNLYFNDERGINGVAYKEKSPNGKQEFVYKMNGFRALLAEMKFTPFLPIINRYINEVLGIHAVCFEHINLSTVPGFPKLLRAQLLLSKFNYQVYMPEIPLPDNDGALSSDTRNPFSACIAYETMRWYYQRCIMLGDDLDRLLHVDDKAQQITVNSLEFYMRTIFANRTALLPCRFVDSSMSLYIADEDHLKKLLLIKQDAMKKVQNVSDNFAPNENEIRFMKESGQLANHIDIAATYAKYIGRSSEILSVIKRAKDNPNQHEKMTSGNGDGDIEIWYNGIACMVKYKGKEYNADVKFSVNNFLDAWLYEPMRQEFIKKTETLKNEYEDPLVSDVTIDKENSALNITVNTAGYLSKAERKDVTKESTRYYKTKGTVLKTDPDKIFEDSVISLQLVYTSTNFDLSRMKTGKYNFKQLDLERCLNKLQECYPSSIDPVCDRNGALSFIKWCQTTGQGIVDANTEAATLKDSIDYEDARSLKYTLLLDHVNVSQFSASVGNTYARIGISGIDGSAPQYMGGQDTHLTWTIETTDETVASVFKSLPELTAYYTRTYRKVLPTYPIKIDSEFTRMLGVIEITMDNVVVTTVENFPGLYRIVVNATSVDRTLRNKESLKLIDIKNQGLEDSRKRKAVTIQSYSEINSKFCQAEIYPDLELPKIGELGELGWRYIRYRVKERQENDYYIDPDFYFVYPNLTVGRAIIEALRCTFDEKLRKEIPDGAIAQYLSSSTGEQYNVRSSGSVDPKQMNTTAKESMQERQLLKIGASKQDDTYYLDPVKSALLRIPYGSINVCKRIRCVFMEPYYIRETQQAKPDDNKANTSKEKIAKVKVKNKDQKTLDKAAKKVSPEYNKICFILESDGKEITTQSNPNYDKEKAEIISNYFTKFQDCAKEIELYLKEKDDNLEKANFVSAQAESAAVKNPADDKITTTYDGDNIKRYLEESGLWNALKKYNILSRTNFATMVEDDDSMSGLDRYKKYTTKDGNFNAYAKSSEEEATLNDVVYLVQAVADAISSREECSANNKTKNFFTHPWQADINKPRAVNGTTVYDTKETIQKSNAVSFGIFGIRRYTYNEMSRILPKEELRELQNEYLKDKNAYYVLDPHFRYKSKEVKDRYLLNCANSPSFCLQAFCRIVAWYMAKLIRYHIIPSIEFDVKRDESINITDANHAAEQFLNKKGIAYKSANQFFKDLKAFAQDNGQAFDTGKFFAAILLALTGEGFGKNTLFDMYNVRDYNHLNQLIQSVTSVKYKIHNENDPTFLNRNRLLRRYLLALYGYGVIPDPNNMGADVSTSPANKFLGEYNTRIALEACGNPVQYMRDSFYDMIRHDYRGRMLRAFPTFYMIFIDEGREIGLWKLHDNFYNFNAIHEIQIVKSRKLAADTCIVTLSNMFQTFTTNDEDCLANYKGSFGDLYESFMKPKTEAERLELRRLAAKKINRAKLQPGIRIHVRVGYGANAADLPGIFNGVIAEVQNGEMVKIVAQGDGIELCNPIYMEETADIIRNNDNVATMDNIVCGAPPAQILQRLLTAKGGPLAAFVRGQYYRNFFGSGKTEGPSFDRDGWVMYGLYNIFKNNPYGIRHFGDPEYRDIFKQGEPCQNIYHITNKNTNSIFFDAEDLSGRAYFGDESLDLDTDYSGLYGDGNDNLPYISFKPFGRTVWDMMHICKSIKPDYVVGITDFEFRSSVFMGLPHFYYAYKYGIGGDGQSLYEKRKPYQQWHLYNNLSDIVENKISASSEKMKTNATGLYEVEGGGIKKTEPMWVDQDIYPEYQKSMVVDTKLYGKSWFKHNAIIGGIMGFTNHIPLAGDFIDWLADGVAMVTNDLMDNWFATWFDNRGEIQSHSTQAEDAVIDALKNSVKEMYQGYMIVLGDPSIKPNDRIHITDSYEDMNGLCDVREVVQTLNPYTGFTTTITPDCISAHELSTELGKMNVGLQFLARAVEGAAIATVGTAVGHYLASRGQAVTSKLLSGSALEKAMLKGEQVLVKFGDGTIAKTQAEVYKKQADLLKVLSKDAKGMTQWISSHKDRAVLLGKYLIDKLGLGIVKVPASMGGASSTLAGGLTLGKALTLAVKPAGLLGQVVFSIITGAANSALYRTAKGMQALYIFPLRKFGKAFTAGLDGQQGLVYGTIQFNKPGPLEQQLGKWFAHSKSGVIKFLQSLVMDEQVMNEMDKWDFDEDADFRAQAMVGNKDTLNQVELQSFSGVHIDRALYRPRSAYAMSLMPRAMVEGVEKKLLANADWTTNNQENIRQAVRGRYYIDNIDTWPVHPNLRNLIYIEDSLQLKTYFISGFLRTLQQVLVNVTVNNKSGLNKDNLIYYSVRMPKGNTRQVAGIKRVEKNKKTGENIITVDIPYTSEEGIQILSELCSYIHLNTSYLSRPDTKEINQKNKDTSIIISSADIIGSQNDLYGSGFHLILTGTGTLGEAGILKKCVEKYKAAIEEQVKINSDKYEHIPLFTLDKMDKPNEVGISIGPPSPFGNNMAKKPTDAENNTKIPVKNTDTVTKEKPDLQDGSQYDQHVSYSDLDELGRCGSAYARLTYKDIQRYANTNADRESLQKVHPAGYGFYTYTANGQDKRLWEKCHLIAYALIGEQANPKNLVTGTVEFNDRMKTYETLVRKYLKDNQTNTVLYKVTPVYEGTNPVPSYVIMEATDQIQGNKQPDKKWQTEIPFKVKVYNTASGIEIDYSKGIQKK